MDTAISSTERSEYLQEKEKEIQWRLRHYETMKRYRKRHAKRFKEMRKVYDQRYKAKDPEKYAEINRAKSARYKEAHREELREKDRLRWRKKHPNGPGKGRKPKPVQNSLGEFFTSAKEAAKKYGVTDSAIAYACKRAKYTCCGLQWHYVQPTNSVVESDV